MSVCVREPAIFRAAVCLSVSLTSFIDVCFRVLVRCIHLGKYNCSSSSFISLFFLCFMVISFFIVKLVVFFVFLRSCACFLFVTGILVTKLLEYEQKAKKSKIYKKHKIN